MNDDLDSDESMKRFEDLGRKLFQIPKEEVIEDSPTEEEPEADE